MQRTTAAGGLLVDRPEATVPHFTSSYVLGTSYLGVDMFSALSFSPLSFLLTSLADLLR